MNEQEKIKKLIAALEFVLTDGNTTLDYECRLILEDTLNQVKEA